jgi:hypothetical protein
MKVTIEDGQLVIRAPIQKPTASKSGKTLMLASTSGFLATTAVFEGKPVILSMNAMIKAT